MSRMDERAVARKLAERDDIEPPAGLLAKIRSEIPAEIRVSPELNRSAGVPEDAGMPRRQRWLIAASLVAAVGAGLLGWELRGRAPILAGEEMEEESAAAPRQEADAAAPLLHQAPAAPAAPEAAIQEKAVPAEPRQEEPPNRPPQSLTGGASGSPQPLEAQPSEKLQEMESQVEALPVSPPETSQRRDQPVRGLVLPPPPPAPAPAPPVPEAAEDPDGFVVSEEVVVTGVASEARSSAMDSSLYRQSSVRPSGDLMTEKAPQSSFGLNVGTASYEVARRSLGGGELPDPGSVRVEEWVNYFHYGDQAPSRADFNVTAQGAPTPFTPGAQYRLVRFNVRGREVDPRNRVIAREVRVQVDWNPEMVASYRLLGYENGGDGSRRSLQATGGEIGAGHSVTALYEVKLRPGAAGGRPLGTLRLRWRSPESGKVSEVEKDLRLSDLSSSWEAASPALRLAAAVAEMAEILKGSYRARGGSLDEVFREAQRISPRFPGDADVAEFVGLAGKAARLKGTAAAEPR